MIFVIYVILGVLIAVLYEYLMPKISRKEALVIHGYRLHHSLYGLAAIGGGIMMGTYDSIALGVGILIQHTITDGFRFISKET